MTLFQDFYQSPSLQGQPSAGLDERFPSAVAGSPLRLWSPGDPIPRQGQWLLVGVATWSAHDMQLLDAVSQALEGGPTGLAVSVFNVANCQSADAFEVYVPGVGSVFHTPVVGLWSEGKLVEKASGRAGRDLVARVCGLGQE
jgi:hypothetical protein